MSKKKKSEISEKQNKKPTKKTQRKNKNKALPGSDLIIFTDGGCETPGGKGAYGVVLYHQSSGDTEVFSKAFESTTNNRMELLAVIVALEKIRKPEPIVLYSDSKYVVNTAKDKFGRFANRDLWERFDEVSRNKNILFIWIQGHNGHRYNELCDQMCTKAMQNGPYAIDEGYVELLRKKASLEKAIVENHDLSSIARSKFEEIPEEFEVKPAEQTVKEYSAEYAVHLSCAKQLLYFYQYDFHAAKHYAAIKTGGRDYWSGIRDKEMRLILGEERMNVLEVYLDEVNAIKAAKWMCRGMTMSDAIKKTLIDAELYKKSESTEG